MCGRDDLGFWVEGVRAWGLWLGDKSSAAFEKASGATGGTDCCPPSFHAFSELLVFLLFLCFNYLQHISDDLGTAQPSYGTRRCNTICAGIAKSSLLSQ